MRTIYDFERAKAAVRSYQLRKMGDPEPSNEPPWWLRGCEPHTEITMPAPNLPGESKRKALSYAALAHLIQTALLTDPEGTRIALSCLTPKGRRVVPLTRHRKPPGAEIGEIRYDWPSYREIGRRFGMDHSCVIYQLNKFLKRICIGMHDEAEGDVWLWRVKRKRKTRTESLAGASRQ